MKEYKKAKGAGNGKKEKKPKSSTHSRPPKAMPRDKAVKVPEIRLDVIAREARTVRDGFDGLRISLDFLEFHFNELKKDIEDLKKSIRGAGGKNRAAEKKPGPAKKEGLSEAAARFGGLSRSGAPVTDEYLKRLIWSYNSKYMADHVAPRESGK